MSQLAVALLLERGHCVLHSRCEACCEDVVREPGITMKSWEISEQAGWSLLPNGAPGWPTSCPFMVTALKPSRGSDPEAASQQAGADMGRGALLVTPVTSVHDAADNVTSPRLQPNVRVERRRAEQGLNVAANLQAGSTGQAALDQKQTVERHFGHGMF